MTKLTALFEQHNARQYDQISFEIGKSMGGSVATSDYARGGQLIWLKDHWKDAFSRGQYLLVEIEASL